ncbi:MAG TPA: cellulase family glycosylhydrolase [Solirubrobacteraceae bacterium]|nr:cellulase family glycosylhydrolase [Solirubrobacteraceae bacterium]
MPRIRILLLSLLAGSLLAGSAGAAQALASHGQITYFEASEDLLSPSTRAHTIAQLKYEGVNALRIELYWESVAPGANSATKPDFEATSPAAYHWGQYPAVLAEAKRLGWQVLLTVTSPVPRWATSNGTAPYVTRPDSKDFEEFMTAVAREFGPEVSTYAIWNEPNHPAFLMPQFNANGSPASGHIYRGLYEAGYQGLQAAGLAHPRVLFGETAPTGYESVRSMVRSRNRKEKADAPLHEVAPLTFLREALCLNAAYKKSATCSELQMAGYSHHAYTEAAGPFYVPVQRSNVMIGSLSRLSNALNLAARAHAIPAGVPIYLTEFGIQSYPNRQEGVPVAKQAEYDAIAERIAYENPRVAAFSQYLLKDDPLGGAPGASVHGGRVGFQTGLEYVSGQPKPLYYGWPIPLTVTRTRGGVALWGLVRPGTGARTVTVLVKAKHAKRWRTLKTVHTNSRGYWSLDSSTAGEYWRVRWTSPEHVKYEGPEIRAY